ncbi:MAG: GlsB/YeaQ/YmgE family stress response membrane protein [Myxococcota bacterium]|nr:GlsB/YeaQ/YmgE family stress response membrane protein [Myxococcota bacterium]
MLWTILIGFFVGLFARWILPGDQARGWIMTTLVGVGGAVLATFIGQNLGWYAQGDRAGFLASIGGAVVLLAAYQAIRPRVRRELPPAERP